MTVNEIKKWFYALKEDDFKDERKLLRKLQRKLEAINTKINELGNNAATTFVCALVAEKYTLVLNIGDSRAYMVNGSNFSQISVDDAEVNELYKMGLIETKDDMRFCKLSNTITSCLGYGSLNVMPNVAIIPNNEFDAILLFSDGVTDCLSDDQIYAVTKNTSPKKIAQKIVDKALHTVSKRAKKESDRLPFFDEIPAGKDNATAAVLLNKIKKGEHRDDR
ncbi:MAG: protein phosphatase 2C domain-containing protein [Clostridia bacterium]|nr:protein phosphatase 2C domain-containing protein [Clostridia bacterium]